MKIKFVGALGTVLGSCTLIKHRSRHYLVDCGNQNASNGDRLPIHPAKIHAVFLTHAHLDHCGLLPWLHRHGFRGKIYCTRATADLTRLALHDAAAFSDGLFTTEDVKQLQFDCPDEHPDFQFGRFFGIAHNLTVAFIRTSHVLGSVAMEFQFSGAGVQYRRTIVFSGDIGCNMDAKPYQMLLNGRQYPSTHAEYLVCESTYGDRVRDPKHTNFKDRVAALKELLLDAVARGVGAAIVFPAFSLQRTQELIADLHHVLESAFSESEVRELLARSGGKAGHLADILVDSPLATKHGEVFVRELYRLRTNGKPFYLNHELYSRLGVDRQSLEPLLRFLFCGQPPAVPPCHYTLSHGETPSQRGALVQIIIAGAGMCNGGRVTQHLKRLLTTSKTTVALTGFQGPGTPGAELMKRARDPEAEIDASPWDLSSVHIKATVKNISPYYSGHADQAGLLDFILRKNSPHSYLPLKRVFLNHGEEESRLVLKAEIESRAVQRCAEDRIVEKVELPWHDSGWFDLLNNRWESDSQ